MVLMTDDPTDTSAPRDRDDDASGAERPPSADEATARPAADEATARPAAGAERPAGSTRASRSGTAGADTMGSEGSGDDGTGEGDGGEKAKLRRGGGKDKVLAGVCHGAGRYFDVDPVIFRIVLAVLTLTGGIGLIIYGMGWLVIPQEGEDESEAHHLLSGRIEGAPLTAVLMALVGCGLYASMIGSGPDQAFSLLLLAATAAAVYWSLQRGRMPAAGETPFVSASAVADAPPAAQAPPEPGSKPSWWRETLTKQPSYLWGPDDGPYEEADRQAWRERKKATRAERLWPFGLVVFLLAATAAGVGTGVSWQYEPLGSSLEIGLSSALGVFGLGYLVASFAGRPRGGTAFWSLLTIAGLIGAAALPKAGQGVGETTWRPTTASAVRASYERGAGISTLDLTAIRLNGATVHSRMKLGAGKVVVKLPANAAVHILYNVGLGQVLLPGKVHNNGVHIKNARHERLGYSPPPGNLNTGTVDLDLTIGVGQLEVIR
jgi:phage shock protein PspC (stress-responsive transcriptional regulator)